MTLLRIRMQAPDGDGGELQGGAVRVTPSMSAVLQTTQPIAAAWGCELIRSEEMLFPPFGGKPGLLLLPEIIFRKQGVLLAVNPEAGEITVEREEEATTWEDFLLMKVAHNLAQQHGGVLLYEDNPEPLAVEPERFATFEHYVDKVLESEDELVKEMKRVWIYAHRKRAVR